MNTYQSGRHFLQIPGPTNVPDRVLRAMDLPTIDHRGPDFAAIGKRALAGMKRIVRTETGQVVIYPASGTGAWEAALVNTLSPGDRVVMFETGHFAWLWDRLAKRIGLEPQVIGEDWRRGADADAIEAALRADTGREIKAVCVVQNETSTGCATQVPEIRAAIDAAGHPALLMVDTISSLASIDMRMDEWGVDVIVAGSQKGLMLPPGLSFNAVSDKAIAASRDAKLPRSFWAWDEMIANNKYGYFPYTPATNMLYALATAIDMLHEEGLDNVFARHKRHAEATRRAVATWGLENLSNSPKHFSPVLTAVMVPAGHSADALRKTILDHFDLSLGTGLSKIADKVFRIGHLGDTNDLTILGTLAGVEMGLGLAKVPHKSGGVAAAMQYLAETAKPFPG